MKINVIQELQRMNKTATVIILIILVLAGTGISTANIKEVQAKPIWLSVDVWTSRGGEGEGVPGGSYKVGEQVVLYFKTSLDCPAKFTLMGPGGTQSVQLSMQSNKIQTRPLGVAEASDIGTWQVSFEASAYTQYRTDITSFTVTGTVTPTPPPTIVIPSIPPPTTPSTTPPATTPTTPAESTPPADATTPAPSEQQETPVTIDTVTSNELLALLALKASNGQQDFNQKLDADKDGKITLSDARIFLKRAVNK